MTPPPADPEYWKRVYGDEWESASKSVIGLHKRITKAIPELEDAAKFGLGATTGKKVKFPPGEKHEEDIVYYYDYKLLCGIQVSAPQKGKVPPQDIWVLKGKYDLAVKKEAAGEKTWFYFEYPLTKCTYALDADTIKPYAAKANTKYLKRDSDGNRIGEVYIDVPYSKAAKSQTIIDWLRAEIIRRKKK